ncbi:unnamed protein product [Lactuca saligna]|uniref:Uncharacterized protein n=1 Tax=Lactuca saligna TaxID=75948 RepID=A0AA36A1L7_LACSI|nr:unnamed protein product [Lactuca saligna]
MAVIEYIDLQVFQGQGNISLMGLDKKAIDQGEMEMFLHRDLFMEGKMWRKSQRVAVILLNEIKQLQKKLIFEVKKSDSLPEESGNNSEREEGELKPDPKPAPLV